MTFCKVLAEKEKGNDLITAYELWDKGSNRPHYEITVSRESIAYLVIPTAKTTWKRKFKELTE